jgi:RND family efflux transporter MFP subunit
MTFRILSIALTLVTLVNGSISLGQSVIQRTSASIDMLGSLEPFRSTEVATAEFGIVREVLVRRGEFIQSGLPIGRLDSEQQKAALKEAEADAFALGTLETARREVEFSSRRVQQTRPLVEQSKASPRELEKFELDLKIAEAKFQAQTDLKQLSQARLEKSQIALSERTIHAPHDGIVVEIYKEEGEYIAGNAPAFVKLLDISKLRATFMLSEALADKFRSRTTAEIRLSNHLVVAGKIEYVAPFADAQGHTIELTVIIENPDHSIRASNCELVLP